MAALRCACTGRSKCGQCTVTVRSGERRIGAEDQSAAQIMRVRRSRTVSSSVSPGSRAAKPSSRSALRRVAVTRRAGHLDGDAVDGRLLVERAVELLDERRARAAPSFGQLAAAAARTFATRSRRPKNSAQRPVRAAEQVALAGAARARAPSTVAARRVARVDEVDAAVGHHRDLALAGSAHVAGRRQPAIAGAEQQARVDRRRPRCRARAPSSNASFSW